MSLSQIASLVGSVVATITILTLFFRIGADRKGITDTLKSLQDQRDEDRKMTTKLAEILDSHMSAGSPLQHVNPEMERRAYEDRIRWQTRIEGKLDELVKK